MLARIRRWLEGRAMARRIAALDDDQRRRIVAASPLEAAAFQGEGYHVFRRGEPDIKAAYVTSLGEIAPRDAEDWIIGHWLGEGRPIPDAEPPPGR